MGGIGAGAREEALDQIRQLGINNIRVRDADLEGEKLLEARRKGSWGLSMADLEVLEEIRERVRRSRTEYLRWGRDTCNWALHLLRRE